MKQTNVQNKQQQATDKEYVKPTIDQNRPIVESQITKSKDGKYMIHRTVITSIKPMKYYEAVMGKKD
ncbi:MAG TPA: hypothetical protein VJK72_04100 [Candidatus Nanoarchaeia archaeon]|nr:hypothetical protein [Candidatus Nanoarchaeia archaeon]